MENFWPFQISTLPTPPGIPIKLILSFPKASHSSLMLFSFGEIPFCFISDSFYSYYLQVYSSFPLPCLMGLLLVIDTAGVRQCLFWVTFDWLIILNSNCVYLFAHLITFGCRHCGFYHVGCLIFYIPIHTLDLCFRMQIATWKPRSFGVLLS